MTRSTEEARKPRKRVARAAMPTLASEASTSLPIDPPAAAAHANGHSALATVASDASPQPDAPADFDRLVAQHLRTGPHLKRSSRGDGDERTGFDIDVLKRPNAVLEVHFADGSVYYTAPADFVREHAAPPAPTRGGTATEVQLPFELTSRRLPRSRAAASASAIERYAISELMEPSVLDRVFDAAETLRQFGGDRIERWFGLGKADASKVTLAAKLCAAFENSVLHPAVGDVGGALLHWREGAWAALAPGQAVIGAGRPALVLLHGTASSTEGSFGKLWKGDEGGRVPHDFAKLAQSHVLLAWEHRTLTRSPLDNAIELVDALLGALPERCRIDVVSHSRGGLVGELFALRTAAGLDAAQAGFEEVFAQRGSKAGAQRDGAHPDAKLVGALFERLGQAARRFDAGSFVRVACPARGTLLADGRTDLFLSLALRALGLATSGVGALLFERFSQLVKSLVAARADAQGLPGLEAMRPGSALTLALAHCEARPTDRLRVIAGDAAARGLSGLLTLVADVFYGWHDHDYVVHTLSMLGGLKRSEAALCLRWEDASVSHFGYFGAGRRERSALFTALAASDDGFEPIAEAERNTRAAQRGQRGVLQAFKRDPLARRDFEHWRAACTAPEHAGKPVLLLLAGIMGSELKRKAAPADEGPTWLSLGSMLRGRLEDLELARGALVPSGLLAVSYELLLEAAGKQGFHALTFPFDWRCSIDESGRALVQRLEEIVAALGPSGVPVHVVAHSMGGLVARDALFIQPKGRELWQTLKARDSRLLMLGTPHKGSYAPAQLLCGQHALAQILGLLARKVSGESFAVYGAGFPGLMQMLPQKPDEVFGDLFDPAAWRAIAQKGPVQVPDLKVLQQAAAYVRSDAFQRSFDELCRDPHALYVAGIGETPVQMRAGRARTDSWIGFDGEAGDTPAPTAIEFLAGPHGDGTVPWTSILEGRTWYVPCEHGTLADHRDSFAGYFELLRGGDTQKLPRQPGPSRGAGTQPDAEIDTALAAEPLLVLRGPLAPALLPTTDEDLAACVLQLAAAQPLPAPTAEPIEVRVVHGGLDYARHPLMVGHYLDEAPSGAVKRVDEKLDGQLQRLLDWRLFVGAARTAHYLRPNNHGHGEPPYRGAIVLGLGSIGQLTPGSLAETVARGVLRYAFEHMHRDPYAPRAPAPVELRLSSLLVGTQIQAVTVRDALGGIVEGVWRAAQLLLQMSSSRVVRIRELEIVEIDEHTALDAAYELRRLMQRGEWKERLHWPSPVLEWREGGICGYRVRSGSSTWQRLVVQQDKLGGLAFTLIGERARVESTQVYSDVQSLRRFIDRVSDDRAEDGDPTLGATDPALGRVLFQMLLPNDLKSRLANLDNTVLVLDDETARYPWELLTPPNTGADGEPVRPFVVHAGLVRQRKSDEYRRLPQSNTSRQVLIVGAPATDGWKDEHGKPIAFSDLDGARREAQLVERLLCDSGCWTPKALIGPRPSKDQTARAGVSRRVAQSFEQVRVALLDRPYRMLHLCGHGVVDQFIRRIGGDADARPVLKTGMLLSDQEVLGAGDVEQMNPAPEFVFINCCYSGRDGDAAMVGGPRRTRQDAVLASSLAAKFIEMGARAVIAAGWQVEDEAALHFAEAFYSRLLGGAAFGDAVREARAEVYLKHGKRSNTWGAYQCYGDPAWRLVEGEASEAAEGTSRLREAELCMSAGELAARIHQVVAVAGDKPERAVLRQLQELIERLQRDPHRKGWLADSQVRGALGLAYRELGEHASAARWLQLGARTADSGVQLGQLDMLVNSLARAGDPKARVAAMQLLGRLDRIGRDRAGRWPLADSEPVEPRSASERLALRGSARLRSLRDRLQQHQDPVHALTRAADCFARAYHAMRVEKMARLDRCSYTLSNTLLSAGLLALLDRQDAWAACAGAGRKSAEWWCAEATQRLQALSASDDTGTFWRLATRLELHAARGLFASATSVSAAAEGQHDIEQAQALIDAVLVRWPSPIQLESLRHRFELMLLVCSPRRQIEDARQKLTNQVADLAEKALKRLKSRFEQPAAGPL